MPPKVSVLMPSYNHEDFVGPAIQSVVRQDFEDWELIVVDDASTDDSWEVISNFVDSRIHQLRNPENLGVCETYNRAALQAQGDIIMTLGSDDRFLPA